MDAARTLLAMRRRLALVVVVLSALALSACGVDRSNTAEPVDNQETFTATLVIKAFSTGAYDVRDSSCYFGEVQYEVRDGDGSALAGGSIDGNGIWPNGSECLDEVDIELPRSEFYDFRFAGSDPDQDDAGDSVGDWVIEELVSADDMEAAQNEIEFTVE
jgi:hypothetical protein